MFFRFRRILPGLATLAALLAPPVAAQEKGTASDEAPPGYWVEVNAAERGGAWADLEARYGGPWSLYVDPVSPAPRMLAGPGIGLGMAIRPDEAGIARMRSFLEEQNALLGIEDPSVFVLERAVGVDNPWNQEVVFINFKQTHGGLDVWHQARDGAREHLAMVKFHVNGTLGRLVLFGSDAVPGLKLPGTVVLGEEEALARALASIPGAALTATHTSTRSYVSVRSTGRFLAREAWVASHEPPYDFRFIFNAHTGELIERRDELRHQVGGTIQSGSLDFPLNPAPGGTFSVKPARSLTVNSSSGPSTATAYDGSYAFSGLPGAVTLSGRFLGPYCNVSDQSGNGNLSFSQPANPPGTVNVTLNPTSAAEYETSEATTFHWVNETWWFVRKRYKTWNGLLALNTRANVNASCNATWSSSTQTVSFYRSSTTCNNTGYQEVVAHEWGHGLHWTFHGSTSPGGFSEGIGDHMGLYLSRQRIMGRNFRLNGTSVRDYRAGQPANNTQWPGVGCSGQVHCVGQVWAGFTIDMWDNLSTNHGPVVGPDIAERISIAQYASNPADQPDGVAGCFTMDDDNGNLADGTPNCQAIKDAATRHALPIPATLPANCGAGPSPTTITLNNGPGDRTLSVAADGYGSFGLNVGGGTTNLLYDPEGAAAPIATTYQSAVLFRAPREGINQWLTTQSGFAGANTGNMQPIRITGSSSTWNHGGFIFGLSQTLCSRDADGSTVQQTYSIRNNTGAEQDIEMIRYADTDIIGSGGDGSGTSNNFTASAPNGHWIYSYDLPGGQDCTTSRPVYAISAEGKDQSNRKVFPCGFRAQQYSDLRTGLTASGCAHLDGSIQNDLNGDRVLCPPELTLDTTIALGVRFPAVPHGATVWFHTRTRLTERTPTLARDVIRESRRGQVVPAGTPVMFANGSSGPCVNVGAAAWQLRMRAAPGGPNPGHYLVYLAVGKPNTGEPCGAPLAMDVAEWNLAGTPMGLGSFSLNPGILSGRGGCPNSVGIPVLSSIPGAAPIPGPPASGGPPGMLLLNVPPLPFNYTLQGFLVDFASTHGGAFSLTNALEINVAGCSCQP